MPVTVTGHIWRPNPNPRMCAKLEVHSTNAGNESSYLLDISGGDKRAYRVQSAMCIPFGTRAMPRNVTGKMPKPITAWVNEFLAGLNQNAVETT